MKSEHDAPPLVWDGLDGAALLTLERLDTNLFRSRYNQRNLNGALYGGQVFGQALAAAVGTVEEGRVPHSCHGYFLRPGHVERRIILEVERTRDGGSFTSRRVVALQNGVPILHLECSFHIPENGFDHQLAMPELADPDTLPELDTLLRSGRVEMPAVLDRLVSAKFPVSVRPADPDNLFSRSSDPSRRYWVRLNHPIVSDDPVTHRVILAYLSDFWLSGATLIPHATPFPSDDIFLTSLDHAIWFHRDMRVDDWLLFDTDSPSASEAIGLARCSIYDRRGRLVASTAQEALHRTRR